VVSIKELSSHIIILSTITINDSIVIIIQDIIVYF
jgi:hypothetical protein